MSCSPATERYEFTASAVLNGQDDRVELFEVEDSATRDAIQRSVGALMWAHRIDLSRPAELRANSARETLRLCDDEAFGQQPAAAFCSATLIDDDLLLTAGHCLGRDAREAAERCHRLWITFDYHYTKPGKLATSSGANIYSCKQVALHDHTATAGELRDVAIIQLDRAVSGDRRPIVIAEAPPHVGDALTAASHGAGLPLKVDTGASVIELLEQANYLIASTDSFAGGSGSPLFNAQMALVGYQVRGAVDWVDDGGCYRAAHAAEPGEQHQLIPTAIDALCASGWPSAALCDAPPTCGDGVCNAGETSDDCTDCEPPRCGDGFCEVSERASCDQDCREFLQVPPAWWEDPATYSAPERAPQGSEVRPMGGCAIQSSGVHGGGLGVLVALAFHRRLRRRSRALRHTSGYRWRSGWVSRPSA